MNTAHDIVRNQMRTQLHRKTTGELLELIALWAHDMRGRTWGTPIQLDADTIEDIRDAAAELQNRTK